MSAMKYETVQLAVAYKSGELAAPPASGFDSSQPSQYRGGIQRIM